MITDVLLLESVTQTMHADKIHLPQHLTPFIYVRVGLASGLSCWSFSSKFCKSSILSYI